MIDYQMMREGWVLTSCLHSGPIALSEVTRAAESPSWLERDAKLPAGTIARGLNALCARYGSCGVMAVDGDAVVGKVRFGPALAQDLIPECAQQFADRWPSFDPDGLPPSKALRIWCVQVVDDGRYRRRGIATAMLERAIAWAREEGWEEIHAGATLAIGPLLEWTGAFSVDAYARLGFSVAASRVSPELLEGVRHMRAGGHGDDVKEQWAAFEHLSDAEAGTLYDVALALRD